MVKSLWQEKYRPNKIDDLILPKETKQVLNQYVEDGEIPHLLFVSPNPGIGKTSAAKAMANEMGLDYKVINASLQNSIDVLRNEIDQFASTVSLQGGESHKMIILDEADNLSDHFLLALRGFMEQFASNCRFVLTANYKKRLEHYKIDSRCTSVDFDYRDTDSQKRAMAEFYNRCIQILDNEGIEYDKRVIAKIVKKFFPDFRTTLNELERYSSAGKIDVGILDHLKDTNIETLVGYLKNHDYGNVRKWVAENKNVDFNNMFRRLYDQLYTYVSDGDIPSATIIIADGQYELVFVADKEISVVATLTKLMLEVSFK